MPDHSTWFSFLPHFADWLTRFRTALGLSFLNQTPIEIQYVIGFAFVGLLLLVMVLSVRGRLANQEKAFLPSDRLTVTNFFEAMVEGTLGLMEDIMGRHHALFFLPLIGTCAFMILFSNLIGLVPGFLPPTSTLNTTLAMAMVIFFVTHIYGVREHGFFKYFAHFMGPIRKWYALPLMLLMFAIELISHVARPVSLAVRLMGNMFADHFVVSTFTGLIPLLVPVPMLLMGVLVCIVQTLVFCLLSTVYISMAVAHEEN